MNKLTKNVLVLVVAMLIVGFAQFKALCEDDDKEYTVYNGFGEEVYVADSLEDAEDFINGNINTRTAKDFLLICKFTAKIVITTLSAIEFIYRTVQWLQNEADMTDLINEIVPYKVLEEMAEKNKRAYIYAKDSFNPYPPHSYQGATWRKTNSYYVLES